MKTRRLIKLFERQCVNLVNANDKHTFSVKTPDGSVYTLGNGTPDFSFVLNNDRAVTALSTLDQNIIIESYLAGDLDIEGDISTLLAMREMLADKRRGQFLWRFIRPVSFWADP
jgi:hypothetical protein